MGQIEVTKMSSKGQVVLPQAIRERLHLSKGEKFIVLGDEDTVILKKIEAPSLERARKLMKASKAYAGKVGLKASDVKKSIRRVRS